MREAELKRSLYGARADHCRSKWIPLEGGRAGWRLMLCLPQLSEIDRHPHKRHTINGLNCIAYAESRPSRFAKIIRVVPFFPT